MGNNSLWVDEAIIKVKSIFEEEVDITPKITIKNATHHNILRVSTTIDGEEMGFGLMFDGGHVPEDKLVTLCETTLESVREMQVKSAVTEVTYG